jgi:hypothetical protein
MGTLSILPDVVELLVKGGADVDAPGMMVVS